LIDKIYAHAIQKSPRLRKLLAYRIYQFLAKRYPMREWTFMNYGYMPTGRGEAPLPLETADVPDRSSIALYNHVAGPFPSMDAMRLRWGADGGAAAPSSRATCTRGP
jgi:hypothetical protein